MKVSDNWPQILKLKIGAIMQNQEDFLWVRIWKQQGEGIKDQVRMARKDERGKVVFMGGHVSVALVVHDDQCSEEYFSVYPGGHKLRSLAEDELYYQGWTLCASENPEECSKYEAALNKYYLRSVLHIKGNDRFRSVLLIKKNDRWVRKIFENGVPKELDISPTLQDLLDRFTPNKRYSVKYQQKIQTALDVETDYVFAAYKLTGVDSKAFRMKRAEIMDGSFNLVNTFWHRSKEFNCTSASIALIEAALKPIETISTVNFLQNFYLAHKGLFFSIYFSYSLYLTALEKKYDWILVDPKNPNIGFSRPRTTWSIFRDARHRNEFFSTHFFALLFGAFKLTNMKLLSPLFSLQHFGIQKEQVLKVATGTLLASSLLFELDRRYPFTYRHVLSAVSWGVLCLECRSLFDIQNNNFFLNALNGFANSLDIIGFSQEKRLLWTAFYSFSYLLYLYYQAKGRYPSVYTGRASDFFWIHSYSPHFGKNLKNNQPINRPLIYDALYLKRLEEYVYLSNPTLGWMTISFCTLVSLGVNHFYTYPRLPSDLASLLSQVEQGSSEYTAGGMEQIKNIFFSGGLAFWKVFLFPFRPTGFYSVGEVSWGQELTQHGLVPINFFRFSLAWAAYYVAFSDQRFSLLRFVRAIRWHFDDTTLAVVNKKNPLYAPDGHNFVDTIYWFLRDIDVAQMDALASEPETLWGSARLLLVFSILKTGDYLSNRFKENYGDRYDILFNTLRYQLGLSKHPPKLEVHSPTVKKETTQNQMSFFHYCKPRHLIQAAAFGAAAYVYFKKR